jgi:hypothetical protein
MFAGTQVQETCGGAALKSAVEALKGGEGGRLHAFLCTLPRRGALHLRLREVGRPPTDRDNLDSLLPEGKEFGALALDAAEHQVSVDLFLLAQSYVDAATLGTLCANTGGSLHHWCPWNPALDADELHNDLRWVLTRPQVWGRGAVAAGRGAWWALHAQTRGHVAAECAQAGMVDPPPSPPLLRAWRRWVACACRAACWWSATWAPSTAAWTQTSTSPRCPATTAWRPSWRMRWAVRLAGIGRAGWGGVGLEACSTSRRAWASALWDTPAPAAAPLVESRRGWRSAARRTCSLRCCTPPSAGSGACGCTRWRCPSRSRWAPPSAAPTWMRTCRTCRARWPARCVLPGGPGARWCVTFVAAVKVEGWRR